MTYAMSMSSEVTTKTIRINMSTNRINMSTRAGVSKAIRLATKLKHFAPAPHRGGVLRDEAATTQTRCAMKIAAQSVVAYLPIVRCAPLHPDARASGRGGY